MKIWNWIEWNHWKYHCFKLFSNKSLVCCWVDNVNFGTLSRQIEIQAMKTENSESFATIKEVLFNTFLIQKWLCTGVLTRNLTYSNNTEFNWIFNIRKHSTLRNSTMSFAFISVHHKQFIYRRMNDFTSNFSVWRSETELNSTEIKSNEMSNTNTTVFYLYWCLNCWTPGLSELYFSADRSFRLTLKQGCLSASSRSAKLI